MCEYFYSVLTAIICDWAMKKLRLNVIDQERNGIELGLFLMLGQILRGGINMIVLKICLFFYVTPAVQRARH